jgi:hypothetical protein
MNKNGSHLHIFYKKLNYLIVALNLHHPLVTAKSLKKFVDMIIILYIRFNILNKMNGQILYKKLTTSTIKICKSTSLT